MMDLRDRIVAEQAIANFNLPETLARTPDRLTRLVQRLGVDEQDAKIRRCFDLVCKESWNPDADWSSLNVDGTPVQFALSLSKGRSTALEFVGEAFRTTMEYPARREFALERMTRLAKAIGVEFELASVRQHLEQATDGTTVGDFEDPVGAFWIGASFGRDGARSMMIYANARRGTEAARWNLLAELAESLAEEEWRRIFAIAEAGALKPLGAGVRVTPDRRPHARVYFGAYGVRPEEYRRMFREVGAGEGFDRALALFFEELLEGTSFPTRSAVFSFGSNGNGGRSPKLELCGHCAWSSDLEAEAHCGKWLRRLGMDADLYVDVVKILGRDPETSGSPQLHAYVGVGMKHDQPYASIYLNPGCGGL
jgi:hypothetical protein